MASSSGTVNNDIPATQFRHLAFLVGALREAHSLRHIIKTRFVNGMPEEFISIVLRDVLEGLNFLHTREQAGYNTNSNDVFFSTDHETIFFGLACNRNKHFKDIGNPWELGNSGPYGIDGVFGLGIIALELAYGSLPKVCARRSKLIAMVGRLVRILKLKLEIYEAKKKNKSIAKFFQSKKKKDEQSTTTITLPADLNEMLDVDYVESQEKELVKKRNDLKMNKLKLTFKNVKKSFKKEEKMNSSEEINQHEIGIDFSRDFVQVLVDLLDKQRHIPAEFMLMERPFLLPKAAIVRAVFRSIVRSNQEG